MTGLENSLMQEEENYYQILSVPSTATLIEIRNAFEEKLEEAHLEDISAYSLLPEVETEEKLLQYTQAFVAGKVVSAKVLLRETWGFCWLKKVIT